MENTLLVTNNGFYTMDSKFITDNRTLKKYSIDKISNNKLLDIIKESILFDIKNSNTYDINTQSQVRKLVYKICENLKDGEKHLMEYEVKFGNILNENVVLLENWFTDSWNWVKDKVSSLGSQSGIVTTMLKNMAQGAFESAFDWLRKAVYSPIGIGVDVFLSATGIMKLGTMAVWGMLLLYDVYLFITKSDKFSWLDVIFDLLGLIGTGVLAKSAKSLFKNVNPKSSLSQIISAGMSNPATKNITTKLYNGIKNGGSWVINKMKSVGSVLSNKLGLKWVNSAIDGVSGVISKILEAFGVVAKQGTTKQGVKSGITAGGIAKGIETGIKKLSGNPYDDIIKLNQEIPVSYEGLKF